jgi:pimeloyl-ACP methyl ester carboxylesterase
MPKWTKILAAILLGLYVVAGTVVYVIQDDLIFHPTVLEENYRFKVGQEVEIALKDASSLNALWVKQANSKGILLYLHGNRGSIARALYQTRYLQGHGYDIFIPDYRGFGKTEGRPSSDQQMFEDIEAVYSFLRDHYREDQIAVVGYSLGTAMATYLGKKFSPQHLFLIAPFSSMVDLKNHYLPYFPNFILRFPFRNDLHVREGRAPITVLHGTEDPLIPFDLAKKIKEINPDLVDLIPLQGQSHRGIIFDPAIGSTLARKLR